MMAILFHVLLEVIVPIFIMIGVGVVAECKLKLDMDTLAKLNFYVFIPALLFIKMIDASLPLTFMVTTAVFCTVQFLAMLGVGFVTFSIPRFRQDRTVLVLATTMYNAGNYGIPLIILAFGDAFIDVIAIIVMMQNVFMFSIGLWLMERESRSLKDILKGMLKIPVIPAIIAGLIVRVSGVIVPGPIRQPLDYLSDAIIPVALITLGAKLARTSITGERVKTSAVTALRLIASPLVSLLLVVMLSIDIVLAPVLIVGTATPVAVNVYILAQSYNKGEDMASRLVFWTTVASAGTVTAWLLVLGG